jgi:CHASE2 domain-containing sensor protein
MKKAQLFLLLGLLACARSNIDSKDFNQAIVILDLANFGKEELATIIKQINPCEPKVIAVNVLFTDNKNERNDSLLALSFGKLVM